MLDNNRRLSMQAKENEDRFFLTLSGGWVIYMSLNECSFILYRTRDGSLRKTAIVYEEVRQGSWLFDTLVSIESFPPLEAKKNAPSPPLSHYFTLCGFRRV